MKKRMERMIVMRMVGMLCGIEIIQETRTRDNKSKIGMSNVVRILICIHM